MRDAAGVELKQASYSYLSVPGRVQTVYYYKNENTLQLLDRIFCRNSSLQAVCDTPIARITGCVSSLRI